MQSDRHILHLTGTFYLEMFWTEREREKLYIQ
jgi:hypothetical protein